MREASSSAGQERQEMATRTYTTPQRKSGEESEFSGPPAETDDDSLILWMLSLTSAQRLEVAQGFADSVAVLRRGRRV